MKKSGYGEKLWNIAVGILLWIIIPAYGLTTYEDGQIHYVDTTINDQVELFDSSQNQATTIIMSRGWVDELLMYEHSRFIAYTRARAGKITAFDNSEIFTDSSFTCSDMETRNYSNIFLKNSYIQNSLKAYDESTLRLETTRVAEFHSYDNSFVQISADTQIAAMQIEGNSQLALTGVCTIENLTSAGTSNITIDAPEQIINIGNAIISSSSSMTVENAKIDGYINVYENGNINIKNGIIYKDLNFYNNSTLNLCGGRTMSHISSYDNSIINISGNATTARITSYDNSQINVFDRTAGYIDIEARMNSNINVLGASGITKLKLYDDAKLQINSGFYSPFSPFEVLAINNSQIEVYGSIIEGVLNLGGNAKLSVYDGMVNSIFAGENSDVRIFGGEIERLLTSGNAEIRIYGADFNYALGEIPDLSGILTGTLLNGDLISIDFSRYSGASIFLVPEPATVLLFALGISFIRNRKN